MITGTDKRRPSRAALQAENAALRAKLDEVERERDQARKEHAGAVLLAAEWRDVAIIRTELHEDAERATQQAWLERDDAHTSLSLVLHELAERDRKAVVFAAPTLAEAVSA